MSICKRRRYFSFSVRIGCAAAVLSASSALAAKRHTHQLAAAQPDSHVAATTEKVSVAIIDSGVDNEHPVLIDQMWLNPGEIAANSQDDDRNAYIDDVFGWNFAERNNSIIDRKYLGNFSEIPYRFFELQTKKLLGTISAEELAWLKAAVGDPQTIQELQKFGNFVHGTHVAGIVASQSSAANIMALKIIPTEVKLPFGKRLQELASQEHLEFPSTKESAVQGGLKKTREAVVQGILFALAQAQAVVMYDVGKYLHRQNTKIANGSFGVSSRSAQNILIPLLRLALGRKPTAAELEFYGDSFVARVVQAQSILPDSSKKTLFVFAAGNDGADNDLHPTSPANIKRDNVITVAATTGTQQIAVFSNYGKKMVDVAAPGTAIRSSAPGQEFLTLSGTSQAAPFVAGVAAAMLAENPALSPMQTKEILIKTVEKFDFLAEKVAAGGIVNHDRAVLAARLAALLPLAEAIQQSEQTYPQGSMPRTHFAALSSGDFSDLAGNVPFVLPLPSPFR